ncbi:MAG: hypothetical protein EOM18_15390, partial [Clostridia bacterium]|nr:hypothetical protein [Clostridia bacterium]
MGGDLQTDKKNLNEKAPAPELILPENLKAVAGTALKEIELPENWTWVNGDTMLSEEISGYAARLAVDDETYDYMAVEGYQAEGHYVERMVPVALTEAKPTEEQTEKSTIATIQPSILVKSALPTPRTGDIGINETTFPDETFRNYIKKVKDKDSDGSLSATEIAGVTEINVKDKTAITSLKGIEYFTALKELNCNSTGITSLDVSSNTA